MRIGPVAWIFLRSQFWSAQSLSKNGPDHSSWNPVPRLSDKRYSPTHGNASSDCRTEYRWQSGKEWSPYWTRSRRWNPSAWYPIWWKHQFPHRTAKSAEWRSANSRKDYVNVQRHCLVRKTRVCAEVIIIVDIIFFCIGLLFGSLFASLRVVQSLHYLDVLFKFIWSFIFGVDRCFDFSQDQLQSIVHGPW